MGTPTKQPITHITIANTRYNGTGTANERQIPPLNSGNYSDLSAMISLQLSNTARRSSPNAYTGFFALRRLELIEFRYRGNSHDSR
jgi:hypothetical protein